MNYRFSYYIMILNMIILLKLLKFNHLIKVFEKIKYKK